MAVIDWKDEMNRMLSGFEHQAMTSLKIMKMAFKSRAALLAPKFKDHFFTASNNRLVETYNQFELDLMHEEETLAPACTSPEVDAVRNEQSTSIDVDTFSDERKDVKSHIKLEQNNDRCKILGLMKTPIAFIAIDDSDDESTTNTPQSKQITLANEVKNTNPTIVEIQCNEIGIKQKVKIQARKEAINDIDDIPIVPAGFNSHNACGTNSSNFDWEDKDNTTLIVSNTNYQNDLKCSVECEKVDGQGNTTAKNEISDAQELNDIMEIDVSDDDNIETKKNNTTNNRVKPRSKTVSQSKKSVQRFKCQICNTIFNISSNLKRHMRTHSGERPHQCDRCPKSFSRLYNLKTHMVVHTKKFPFKCSRCRIGFLSESEKIVHEKKCQTIRYECDVCKKFSVTHLSHFKRHMLIHTGEKPFRCEICMKTFSLKLNLKRHLGTVHKKK